jgi:hypothetical protein
MDGPVHGGSTTILDLSVHVPLQTSRSGRVLPAGHPGPSPRIRSAGGVLRGDADQLPLRPWSSRPRAPAGWRSYRTMGGNMRRLAVSGAGPGWSAIRDVLRKRAGCARQPMEFDCGGLSATPLSHPVRYRNHPGTDVSDQGVPRQFVLGSNRPVHGTAGDRVLCGLYSLGRRRIGSGPRSARSLVVANPPASGQGLDRGRVSCPPMPVSCMYPMACRCRMACR